MTGVVSWFANEREQRAFDRRLAKFFKQFEKINKMRTKKNV